MNHPTFEDFHQADKGTQKAHEVFAGESMLRHGRYASGQPVNPGEESEAMLQTGDPAQHESASADPSEIL